MGINRSGNWAYSPAITVFNPRAFNETNYSFEEIFAYKTIHRSGIPDTYSCSFCLTYHDLATYKPYIELITNCGCSKEKIR